MNTANDKKMLPARQLRFSKRMVALSLVLITAGAIWIMNPWPYAMAGGVILCGAGFALFFIAGYSWGCENESCS